MESRAKDFTASLVTIALNFILMACSNSTVLQLCEKKATPKMRGEYKEQPLESLQQNAYCRSIVK